MGDETFTEEDENGLDQMVGYKLGWRRRQIINFFALMAENQEGDTPLCLAVKAKHGPGECRRVVYDKLRGRV